MDLVDRYMAAVGRQLPAKQAGDILAELREELLARQEERETELGRPLDKKDVEALLVEFGHPLVVAGRYRKTQHLIGPEVFPFWWATMKVVLLIVLGVDVVLFALAELTKGAQVPVGAQAHVNASTPSVLLGLVFVFGLITLIFAAFERFGKTGFLRDWKPRHLPPVQGNSRSAANLCAEIVVDVVFLAWWFGAIHFRNFVPPFFLRVDLAPVWDVWRWPIAAYFAAEMAADVYALARPSQAQLNTGVLIARYVVGIAILVGLLQAGHWLVVSSSQIPAEVLAGIQTNFDLGFRIGLWMTVLGMGVAIAIYGRRWLRARQAEAPLPA
jgi:hypothetical protein